MKLVPHIKEHEALSIKSQAQNDSRYLKLAGGTMTGDLVLYNNILHTLNYSLTVPATGTVALLGTGNVFTTTQTIQSATDVQELIVKGKASQTANIQEWQSSAGGLLSAIEARGTFKCSLGTSVTQLFIGSNAGNPNSTGSFCHGFGYYALNSLTNGSDDFALGYYAGKNITSGSYDCVIGTNAGLGITTSSYNTIVGSATGQSSGGSNAVFGYGAFYSGATTGSGNSIYGTLAGWKLSSANNCVLIGTMAGAYQTTTSNLLIIDNRDYPGRSTAAADLTDALIVGTFAAAPANQTLRINGALTIGFTTASALTIGIGTAGIDYQLKFDGETNDGILTFMEDEKRFDFDSPIDVTGNIEGDTYSAGGVAGIDATVSYTDSLLGAKTLTFIKGILTAQV